MTGQQPDSPSRGPPPSQHPADALITANVEIDDDYVPARWGINNIAVSLPQPVPPDTS